MPYEPALIQLANMSRNKDSKINKKNKRQLKELQGQNKQLQGQLQEYKSREAKRLKGKVYVIWRLKNHIKL
jgi:hypothetical protein